MKMFLSLVITVLLAWFVSASWVNHENDPVIGEQWIHGRMTIVHNFRSINIKSPDGFHYPTEAELMAYLPLRERSERGALVVYPDPLDRTRVLCARMKNGEVQFVGDPKPGARLFRLLVHDGVTPPDRANP